MHGLRGRREEKCVLILGPPSTISLPVAVGKHSVRQLEELPHKGNSSLSCQKMSDQGKVLLNSLLFTNTIAVCVAQGETPSVTAPLVS